MRKDRGQSRAMFWYYGSKVRLAHLYPMPLHQQIIEPFAGSAAYSLQYSRHDVLLIDKDPEVIAIWEFLIAARPSEILALPLFRVGTVVDDLHVCEEARAFLRRWTSIGSSSCRVVSTRGERGWCASKRSQVARDVMRIRHWKVRLGSYVDAPDMRASWFIDPPYIEAGKHYKFGSPLLDYSALGDWCRHRSGQVMVCENANATWLPFTEFVEHKGFQNRFSMEALWYRRSEAK